MTAEEHQLPGGNSSGAVLVDGTVRRPTGPWTPSVHALLNHLEAKQFQGAPRVLGVDSHGREVLSFLPGSTVGETEPWPVWVHSEQALVDVGRWLRRYHDAVADFIPHADAMWRGSLRSWQPGDIIGHNDAAPHNAVWRAGPARASRDGAGEDPQRGDPVRLVGFIDWDFAGPCPPIWDLAFVAFAWVPLHAHNIDSTESLAAAADRPRRLRLLLDAYRYAGTLGDLLDAIRARVSDPHDRRWRPVRRPPGE